MTTADNAPEGDDLPEGQAPPSPEPSGPETEADAREREIQRRLSQSGREAAEARRQAQQAQAALAAQTAQIGQLQASMRLLSEAASTQQREAAARRQREIEAELQSLPPADRLERKIELLQGQINSMRTAAPPARPAPAPPPAAPPEASDAERTAYMERRVREIVQEARDTFGVSVSLQDIADDDWNAEDTFYRSVMKQAALSARGNGGQNVPKQSAAETPAQMRERIRQEERERLGVTSPTAPRATPAGRRKQPTESEVRASVQGYDSKLGPKANLKKLQELRAQMG